MKKLLTLVLALAMLFSVMSMSGAEGTAAELADDQTLRVSIGVDLTDLNPLTESTAEGSEYE